MRTHEEIEKLEQRALNSIRDRFIEERVSGFKDREGNLQPPVSREEATARWDAVAARFLETIKTDADVRKRIGLEPATAN